MPYQLTPYMILDAGIFLVVTSLGVYTVLRYLRHDRRLSVLAFAVLMFSTGGWELAFFMIEGVTDVGLKLLIQNVMNAVVVPIYLFSLLFFALAFAEKAHWIKWVLGLTIAKIVGFSVILAFSPEFLYQVHGFVTMGPFTILGFTFEEWVLLDRTHNPSFLLYQLYAYVVAIVAAVIAIRYIFANKADIYREQGVLIGIGFGTPLLLNTLTFVGVVPLSLNPTDIGFGVTAISFAIAIFKYQMFTAVPVGRQELVGVMDDPIVLVDDENRVVDSNRTARRLFDIDSGWQGIEVAEFFEPHAASIQSTLVADGGAHKLTVEQNGRKHYFDLNTTTVRTPSGKTVGQLIAFRNVSQLEQTKQELEQSNERLDQFASVVSHDLRNPLTVIQGRTQLLRGEAPDEHVDPIERNADRMETMIDDLLTLSRAGESVDDPESVSLADVVADSWTALSSNDIELDLDVPDDVEIEADSDRLRHIFENLFRNAREHNDPPVTVRVGTLADETGAVSGFFIADDGAGIPEAEREKVFEHGFTTNTDGTGFGLSIVEDIIEAHGWTISVGESEAGGARFDVHTTGQT